MQKRSISELGAEHAPNKWETTQAHNNRTENTEHIEVLEHVQNPINEKPHNNRSAMKDLMLASISATTQWIQ